MEDKKSFVLYLDLKDLFEKLSDDDAGKLIKAVFEYGTSGEIIPLPPAADMLLGVICQQMDRDGKKWEETKERRSRAGKVAAQARIDRSAGASNHNESQRIVTNAEQTQPNATVNVNVNGNVNDNGNVNVNESVINNDTAPAPTSKPYGQFGHVMLTDAELARLQQRRPRDWEAKIQRLDDYIEQTGKTYKSHLLTIVRWAEEDDRKAPAQDTSVHFDLDHMGRQQDYDQYFTDPYDINLEGEK